MKMFIKNRNDNDIAVVVEARSDNSHKLAFVMHGLGGSKEEVHLRGLIKILLDNGYGVVSWDAVHSFGESRGGLFEDATITNYYEDLEDVVAWAAEQEWYSEPFLLCGHSLGGISTALFAQNFPERVAALAPISAVVSGELSLTTRSKEDLDNWKKTGVQVSTRRNGTEKRLKWNHMEDRLKYDLLKRSEKLQMPVFLAVGEDDTNTPPTHQELFYKALPGKKELHVIAGARHTFDEAIERQELETYFDHWLKTL